MFQKHGIIWSNLKFLLWLFAQRGLDGNSQHEVHCYGGLDLSGTWTNSCKYMRCFKHAL